MFTNMANISWAELITIATFFFFFAYFLQDCLQGKWYEI